MVRAIVASNEPEMAQRIRAVLIEQGAECPAGHLVPLDGAAVRCGVMHPDVAVFVFPSDWQAGVSAIRETRNTVPRTHALVVGPATDPKRILETLKQGADEFLDRESIETELTGAMLRYRVFRQREETTVGDGRIVAVISSCGGSGASMVATSISAALAQELGQSALVDLRLGVGDLTAMLDVRPGRTLADLCDHVTRLDQALFEQFLTRHSSGIYLLAAPIRTEDVERVTSKGVRRALALAKVRFSRVLIDVGSVLATEQIEALWQADVMLLVARLDYTSVRNARRVIDALNELGFSRDRMQLVINGMGQRRQLEIEQAEAAVGLKVAHRIPYDAATVHAAVNGGMPVVLYSRFSRIAKSLRGLAVSVNGVHKQ